MTPLEVAYIKAFAKKIRALQKAGKLWEGNVPEESNEERAFTLLGKALISHLNEMVWRDIRFQAQISPMRLESYLQAVEEFAQIPPEPI